MQWKMFSVILLILAGLNGCGSIGPATVARDRFDYTTAISDFVTCSIGWSEKESRYRFLVLDQGPIATL
jgi:uncharacterized protein YceK